jgi:hypothetical protein
MHLTIGNRVKTTGRSNYSEDNPAPVGTLGTIVAIRKRYQNTPNAYVQYKVMLDGYKHNLDSLDYLYTTYNLELIS